LRTVISAVLVLVFGPALPMGADPILFAPTGRTLTTGQFRLEAAFSPSNDHGRYFWLGAGLKQLEVNAIRFERPTGGDENMINAQWSFLPETMLTPGVSFGARDIARETEEGLGVYLAVTKHLDAGAVIPLIEGFSATVGIGVGGIKGPFLGFEAKLPLGLFVQAEYDSRDVNAAAGWQPWERLRLKAYNLRDETLFGAELVPIAF